MNIIETYTANTSRYESGMSYRRVGQSGLMLPEISLGLWQNFGFETAFDDIRKMLLFAFDSGITHFDLANNYGPPYGSAEINFGRVLTNDLKPYRDELIISTKAGYDMWPGPYGNWGSRKYLLASLDQSLSRMGLDYVDIFYSHRVDPDTPLEETMGALASAVQQGKALYVGISSYGKDVTRDAVGILKSMGIPCLIHQPSYSMFNRWVEGGLLDELDSLGLGAIAFSPLAQGLLSSKYVDSIPEGSRASQSGGSFDSRLVTPEVKEGLLGLSEIAKRRGQTLTQLAIQWVLRRKTVSSALIGVRNQSQLAECIASLGFSPLSDDELMLIDRYAKDMNLNLWAPSSSHSSAEITRR